MIKGYDLMGLSNLLYMGVWVMMDLEVCEMVNVFVYVMELVISVGFDGVEIYGVNGWFI